MREAFLDHARRLRQSTVAEEPLALMFTWGESAHVPNTFHFQEAYVGKAGYDAHVRTPHYHAWQSFVASGAMAAAPEVAFFNAQCDVPVNTWHKGTG